MVLLSSIIWVLMIKMKLKSNTDIHSIHVNLSNNNLWTLHTQPLPPTFVDLDHRNFFCRLQKLLYRLKKARSSCSVQSSPHHFACDAFTSLKTNVLLFIHVHGAALVYLFVYDDDILIMNSDSGMVDYLITHLTAKFCIWDLNTPHLFPVMLCPYSFKNIKKFWKNVLWPYVSYLHCVFNKITQFIYLGHHTSLGSIKSFEIQVRVIKKKRAKWQKQKYDKS